MPARSPPWRPSGLARGRGRPACPCTVSFAGSPLAKRSGVDQVDHVARAEARACRRAGLARLQHVRAARHLRAALAEVDAERAGPRLRARCAGSRTGNSGFSTRSMPVERDAGVVDRAARVHARGAPCTSSCRRSSFMPTHHDEGSTRSMRRRPTSSRPRRQGEHRADASHFLSHPNASSMVTCSESLRAPVSHKALHTFALNDGAGVAAGSLLDCPPLRGKQRAAGGDDVEFGCRAAFLWAMAARAARRSARP